MNCDQAKELMAGSWLGSCEDPALTQHLTTCLECAAENAALSAMWNRMGDFPVPEPSLALKRRFQATLAAESAGSERKWPVAHWWPRNPVWQVGIAAACLMLGLVAGVNWPRQSGEMAKLHEEIASTRDMVALSLLRQQSAGGRLQGVEYSGRMKTMEPEVVEALVQAIERDSSVNVRLAAIDALGRASRSDGVAQTLTRSLGNQESPMVQAALIDYFVDAHDRGAVGAIRQLAQRPDLNPAVLERSRVALRELSQ